MRSLPRFGQWSGDDNKEITLTEGKKATGATLYAAREKASEGRGRREGGERCSEYFEHLV